MLLVTFIPTSFNILIFVICKHFLIKNVLKTMMFHIVISVPSAPPTSVKVTKVTGNTITVKWKPVECSHQNGEITGYLVQYRVEPSGKELVVNTSEKLITLPNLMPFTTYSIEVAAVNSAGIGNFSSAVTNVTQQSEFEIFLSLRKSNNYNSYL